MSDQNRYSMSSSVLDRLLRPRPESTSTTSPTPKEERGSVRPTERPEIRKAFAKRPGRPTIPDQEKARNFTLCLAPQFVNFLDRMVVRDPKVRGRGRKIRFIIERFIEHEKRSVGQLRVLRESLASVQETISSFGGRVKKGEKLNLTTREKEIIGKAVDQVHLLMKILNYSPKALNKLLPREEWAILSFCLDWKTNRGVIF